jgi:hypothetical protein
LNLKFVFCQVLHYNQRSLALVSLNPQRSRHLPLQSTLFFYVEIRDIKVMINFRMLHYVTNRFATGNTSGIAVSGVLLHSYIFRCQLNLLQKFLLCLLQVDLTLDDRTCVAG